MLSDLLGCGAGDIRFDRHTCPGCGRTGHGRPFIQSPRTSLELSLSRSGPYWLCAVADGVRVGADIERVRPFNAERLARLAEAVLTDGERSYMTEVPTERLPAEFIRCWTRKEAVTRTRGIGIEAAMGRLDVHPERSRALVRHSVGGCPANTWTVRNLPSGRIISPLWHSLSTSRSFFLFFPCLVGDPGGVVPGLGGQVLCGTHGHLVSACGGSGTGRRCPPTTRISLPAREPGDNVRMACLNERRTSPR
ncbi:4'-phosphopantetheinyl transferase superfamily protein [Streptomyces canus]|uniref:4'-phosphopantetheinyl transferase family protein n=1 Tax=Streptomyces canus TaxID=58343 RepID=UPI0033EC7EE7